MNMENKCEHCYCQSTLIYPLNIGNTAPGIKHKVCCNCGHKRSIEGLIDLQKFLESK